MSQTTQEKIATLFDKLTLEEKEATIRNLTEIYHEEIKAEQARLLKLKSLIP